MRSSTQRFMTKKKSTSASGGEKRRVIRRTVAQAKEEDGREPLYFFSSLRRSALLLFHNDTEQQVVRKRLPRRARIQRTSIPVVATFHHPSPHLISLRPRRIAPSLAAVMAEQNRERRWGKLYLLVNEISLFSFIAFIAWLGTTIIEFVFRIPSSALSLPAFGRLPREAREPLPRVRSLRSLAVDRAALMLKQQKAWLKQQSTRLEEVRLPIAPRLVAFAAVAMVFVLPLFAVKSVLRLQDVRAEALGAAHSGLEAFVEGSSLVLKADYSGAADRFANSHEAFARGAAEIERVPLLLRRMVSILPRGREVTAAEQLLEAAQALSVSGEKLAMAAEALGGTREVAHTSPKERWVTLVRLADELARELNRAERALANVRPDDIPTEYREQFSDITTKVTPALAVATEELSLLKEALPDLLGLDEPRRYLMVFQNNNELRPTGGFMGSFALVDVRDGEVKKYTVPGGGTYDLQGSLVKRVASPEPLRLINARWEFQDANWWWDWPTSAQKLEWFYSHAGGETVDGVIALNASIIPALLELTGPIAMPQYGLVVTKDNFIAETTAEVELRYDKEANRPKQFLADLAPKLLEKIETIAEHDGGALLTIFGRAIAEKELQVYRHDEAAQRTVRRLGWGGDVKPLPARTDTLGVVHTNIAGNKTDGVVSTVVHHQARVDERGVTTNTVEIVRTHRGVKGDPFTGVRNVDYLRLYVPQGSRLLRAEGFRPPASDLFDPIDASLKPDEDLSAIEQFVGVVDGVRITNELGRTSFGNWIMVDPGESVRVTFVYELPWTIPVEAGNRSWAQYLSGDTATYFYRLFWEKQPGSGMTHVTHEFQTPTSLTIAAAPSGTTPMENGWKLARDFTKDADLSWTYHY